MYRFESKRQLAQDSRGGQWNACLCVQCNACTPTHDASPHTHIPMTHPCIYRNTYVYTPFNKTPQAFCQPRCTPIIFWCALPPSALQCEISKASVAKTRALACSPRCLSPCPPSLPFCAFYPSGAPSLLVSLSAQQKFPSCPLSDPHYLT